MEIDQLKKEIKEENKPSQKWITDIQTGTDMTIKIE